MKLVSTSIAAIILGVGSANALKTVTYRCSDDGTHVAVPNVCRNTCWGQFCLQIGTQFTYNPSAQTQNRGLSGYNVPSAANPPCGSNSAFGDADLTSIEEFPIAASNNPGATYSLRCASTKEQQAQGGSIQAAGLQNGDLFVFALQNADAGTLGVDWCEPNPICTNDGKQFNLQGNNYIQTTAVDSPLSSLGSTPSPPRERDVTPWIRSLGRTVRFHARAWPSQGRVEILGPI